MKKVRKLQENEQRLKTGIGSYSYRYAVGCSEFAPRSVMDVFGFVEEAERLGLGRVLLCENLGYKDLDLDVFRRLKKILDEKNIIAEVGFRDITVENVRRHIEIATVLGSSFLRAVCAKPSNLPDEDPRGMTDSIKITLQETLPLLKEKGLVLGIENHFDLPTSYLIEIVESIGDEAVGLILDTTNGIGFVEPLDRTMRQVLPYLKSVHIKDFLITKIEAGYIVEGKALGDGQMDFEAVLRTIAVEKPEASIILELSLKRDPSWTERELLSWEKAQVERSAKELVVTMEKINHKEALNV